MSSKMQGLSDGHSEPVDPTGSFGSLLIEAHEYLDGFFAEYNAVYRGIP